MAKSYLNDFNTWVRFDINLPALSPVYFDTPIYVPDNGEDSLPRVAMHVKMRYPKIVADYARRIERQSLSCMSSGGTSTPSCNMFASSTLLCASGCSQETT
jgi:hypothetical protein